jgi:hypothetical protein
MFDWISGPLVRFSSIDERGGVTIAAGILFLDGNDFTLSVRALHQKGSMYQKAAKTVQAAWGRAYAKDKFENRSR